MLIKINLIGHRWYPSVINKMSNYSCYSWTLREILILNQLIVSRGAQSRNRNSQPVRQPTIECTHEAWDSMEFDQSWCELSSRVISQSFTFILDLWYDVFVIKMEYYTSLEMIFFLGLCIFVLPGSFGQGKFREVPLVTFCWTFCYVHCTGITQW